MQAYLRLSACLCYFAVCSLETMDSLEGSKGKEGKEDDDTLRCPLPLSSYPPGHGLNSDNNIHRLLVLGHAAFFAVVASSLYRLTAPASS